MKVPGYAQGLPSFFDDFSTGLRYDFFRSSNAFPTAGPTPEVMPPAPAFSLKIGWRV
jgi:hypothetical protein